MLKTTSQYGKSEKHMAFIGRSTAFPLKVIKHVVEEVPPIASRQATSRFYERGYFWTSAVIYGGFLKQENPKNGWFIINGSYRR